MRLEPPRTENRPRPTDVQKRNGSRCANDAAAAIAFLEVDPRAEANLPQRRVLKGCRDLVILVRIGLLEGVPTGSTRGYSRFTDVIGDMIEARMLNGPHFRRPNVNGAILGQSVADFFQMRCALERAM